MASFNRVSAASFQNNKCYVCKGEFDNGKNFAVAHLDGQNSAIHPIHPGCLKQWFLTGVWLGCDPSTCPTCGINVTHINGVAVESDDKGDHLPDSASTSPKESDETVRAQDDTQQNGADVLIGSDEGNEMQVDDGDSVDISAELYQAAFNGYESEVLEILEKRGISIETRGLAVRYAVEAGRSGVLKILLQNNAQILPEDRGAALKRASMIPHALMVELLLANGSIPDIWIDESLYYGASLGNPSVVRSILESAGTISVEARNLALYAAAALGCWEIVGIFLAHTSDITEEVLGISVMQASQNGRVLTVQMLLNFGPISIRHRSLSVLYATQCNQLQIVQALLANQQQISLVERSDALAYAVKNRNLALVQEILKNGEIRFDYLGLSLCLAARNGDLSIVRALLQLGTMHSDYLGEAARFAIDSSTRSRKEILKAVLEKGIDHRYRGYCVKEAADDGEEDLVILLLQSGPISGEDQQVAFQHAVNAEDLNLAQIIASNTTLINS